MKKFKIIKTTLFLFVLLFISDGVTGQVTIGNISNIKDENIGMRLCFNNSPMMSGNSISDRYLVYFNSDTIYLSVNFNGNWIRKIAYTGAALQLATLSFHNDTIWICWKEGNVLSQIKSIYTANKGLSWSNVINVSTISNVNAPSICASENGKVHFVWTEYTLTDTMVYHNVFFNGTLLASPTPISNINKQGEWPSVIAIGDTVYCAWKELPLPSKVWYRSSYDGGLSWNTPVQPNTLPVSKDPSLSYSFNQPLNTHYIYLTFDSQNKIYMQRSLDFGLSWSSPEIISNPNKLSQFARVESNNSGFVGVAFEHRDGGTMQDDTKKDVGFVYSLDWANSGSFGNDSLAYTNNPYGSIYTSFNKIDDFNYYLVWLTNDTILNNAKIFERKISLNGSSEINANHLSNNKPEIEIYPNPAFDQIYININNNVSVVTKIYNSLGIIQKEYYGTEFSISDLPSGIYYVTIQIENNIFSKKLIKKQKPVYKK